MLPIMAYLLRHNAVHLKAKLNKMQVRENQVPGTPIYEGLQKSLNYY